MNKWIVARRILCLVLSKIGFVIVSYMSTYAESDKFDKLSKDEAECTTHPDFLFELKQIAKILPKIKESMIIYIVFIILIILVNGYQLCKKCYHLLKNGPKGPDEDGMALGEYSHIYMDGLENTPVKALTENPFDIDGKDKPKDQPKIEGKADNENPFMKSPDAVKNEKEDDA